MQSGLTAAPKYKQVHDVLREEIVSGQLPVGARLPSEAALVAQFGASRITVGRAVRDLQRAGLVERRVGSGTYVRAQAAGRDASAAAAPPLTFGLLVPDAEDTEIFGPMLDGVMAAPQPRPAVFARWGDSGGGATRAAAAWATCQQYVEGHVSGVFFAPLEGVSDEDPVNERIVRALDEAGIPVVLLDRAVYPYPRRGPYDLVGIDNRRAGYAATEHVIAQGARRVAFLAQPRAASSVAGRRAGYREALLAWGLAHAPAMELSFDPANGDAMSAFLDDVDPDALVCANDRVAAVAMQTLLAIGIAVPDRVRLIGFDDAEFAAFLPVPLTTVRQPSRAIGLTAAAAMLERLAQPALPARDIFLQTTLVVRASCGRPVR